MKKPMYRETNFLKVPALVCEQVKIQNLAMWFQGSYS